MSDKPEPNDDTQCADCGQFGAVEVAGTFLCSDCYEKRGSCCAGDDE